MYLFKTAQRSSKKAWSLVYQIVTKSYKPSYLCDISDGTDSSDSSDSSDISDSNDSCDSSDQNNNSHQKTEIFNNFLTKKFW